MQLGDREHSLIVLGFWQAPGPRERPAEAGKDSEMGGGGTPARYDMGWEILSGRIDAWPFFFCPPTRSGDCFPPGMPPSDRGSANQ